MTASEGNRLLTLEGIHQDFLVEGRAVRALTRVNLSVARGEFVAIVGPSGCGKSSLLRIVAGLQRPTQGAIRWHHPPPPHGQRTAVLFPEHSLFPWMRVVDNVAFPLEARGHRAGERRAEAATFLEKVGLAEFGSFFPHQLSTGMRQRVGLARALLADPELLLLDEPFAALDAQTRFLLHDELRKIHTDAGRALLMVTHDIWEAITLADRILVITGHPGTVREEFRLPTADFAGDPEGERERIRLRIWELLAGEVRRSMEEVVAPEHAS